MPRRRTAAGLAVALMVGGCSNGGSSSPGGSERGSAGADIDASRTDGGTGATGEVDPDRPDPIRADSLVTIAPIEGDWLLRARGGAPGDEPPDRTLPARPPVSQNAWRDVVEALARGRAGPPETDDRFEPGPEGSVTVRFGQDAATCQAVRLRADLVLEFAAAGNCDFDPPGTTDAARSPWGPTGRILSEFVGQVVGELVVGEVVGGGTTANDRTLGEAAGRLVGLVLTDRGTRSTVPTNVSVARLQGVVAAAVMAGTGRCLWFRSEVADVLDAELVAEQSIRYGIGTAETCTGDHALAADSSEPLVPLT